MCRATIVAASQPGGVYGRMFESMNIVLMNLSLVAVNVVML